MAPPFASRGLFGIPRGRRFFKRRGSEPIRTDRPGGAGRANRSLIMDPLEPRLLFNADVLAVNLTSGPDHQQIDHDVIVRLVDEVAEVAEHAVTVQRVQVL